MLVLSMQDHELHYAIDHEIRELNAKLRFHFMSKKTFDAWARFAQNNGVDFLDMLKTLAKAQETDDPAVLFECEKYCNTHAVCEAEVAVAHLILESGEESFNKNPRVLSSVLDFLESSATWGHAYLLPCLTLAAARFPYVLDGRFQTIASVLRSYVDGEEAVKYLASLHPQVAMQIVTHLDREREPDDDYGHASRLATYALTSRAGMHLIREGVFRGVELAEPTYTPFLGHSSVDEDDPTLAPAFVEVVGFALQINALYMFTNVQEIFAKTRGTKLCFLSNLYDLCERNEEDVEHFYSVFENGTEHTAHSLLVNTTLAYCFCMMYDHVKAIDIEAAIKCCKMSSNNALAYSNAIYALCVSDTLQPIDLPTDL